MDKAKVRQLIGDLETEALRYDRMIAAYVRAVSAQEATQEELDRVAAERDREVGKIRSALMQEIGI